MRLPDKCIARHEMPKNPAVGYQPSAKATAKPNTGYTDLTDHTEEPGDTQNHAVATARCTNSSSAAANLQCLDHDDACRSHRPHFTTPKREINSHPRFPHQERSSTTLMAILQFKTGFIRHTTTYAYDSGVEFKAHEEVIFAQGCIAYDRLVCAPRSTRDGR